MTQIEVDWSVPTQDRARLKGQNLAIYERLLRGPATNAELAALALKYTSRIDDLRKAGANIPEPVRVSGGLFRYELVQS